MHWMLFFILGLCSLCSCGWARRDSLQHYLAWFLSKIHVCIYAEKHIISNRRCVCVCTSNKPIKWLNFLSGGGFRTDTFVYTSTKAKSQTSVSKHPPIQVRVSADGEGGSCRQVCLHWKLRRQRHYLLSENTAFMLLIFFSKKKSSIRLLRLLYFSYKIRVLFG